MDSYSSFFLSFVNYGIFIYAVILMSFYLVLSVVAYSALRRYQHKNKTTNFDDILRSPLSPKISIIAPAYNEQLSIVANIRSLLSLHYNNYEIIVVNDGSKDDSIRLMIDAYDLKEVHLKPVSLLPHKPVRKIFKSKNEAFAKLTVVDKENGGKSDALNAGICYSNADYVACIDVDCILREDSLLRMVKPFLEEVKVRLIAVGGVIRVANNCSVKHGRIEQVSFPKKWLARFQVLEYIRAFILGRMAWARMNGLMLISGAFGMFERALLVEVGGYDTTTVGEDMELVVRMRRLLYEQKIPHKVSFIPEPLCWTEVPEDRHILVKQRDRWTRGTIETLSAHKVMFFNPKYKILGLLSYPFWFFFEWLAPIIEFSGILYFIFLIALGHVSLYYFFLLTVLVYVFGVAYSLLAIFIEEATFREYTRPKSLILLMFTALIEPFFYHPLTMFCAIRGNYTKFIKKQKSWGEQKRKGFVTSV